MPLSQEELVEICRGLKNITKRYEGPFQSKVDGDSSYDLWSFKDLVIAGRKRKEMFFASIVIREPETLPHLLREGHVINEGCLEQVLVHLDVLPRVLH